MHKQRNRIQPRVRAKYDRSTGLVRLNVPLSVKAESIDLAERTFEGLAATWDEDLGSDIIHKGAFKKSISTWKNSAEAMPLINSHDHFDIFSAIGQALAMREVDEGLWTKWEVIEGDDGDRVLTRIRPSPRTGRAIIGKMSIGFVPTKFDFEQPEGTESFWDRIRHINEADLKEVSLVLFPMNPNASIDAGTVKMWLKAAHEADPRQLDSITRKELRRLNTRIGLLLKKQKPEDEAEVDETSEDEQPSPSTQTASSQTESTESPDSDDETDDTEAEEEDEASEDVDDTDDSEEGADTDDAEEEQPVSAPDPAPNTESSSEAEPKTYVYSEALQHRLRKVLLKNKISETTLK